MSGEIILILSLQLLTSFDINAGKLGDTIYVILLKTSCSHVAVTKIKKNKIILRHVRHISDK